MTGHHASRPVTQVYLHLKPRSRTADLDQNSSPGRSVRAILFLLVVLRTADYAEQQATSTPLTSTFTTSFGIIRCSA